jgi:MFS family permease
MIAGPVLGGVLVDGAGWRWIFVVTTVPVDVVGAILAVFGVGGVVLGLIEQERLGWSAPLVLTALTVGARTPAVE